ncbi:MAG: hypothetical protein M3P87_01010 [Actinomycetota bacterium]|nr:hypothetical protein [Actinomycetota bacterium]
MRGVRLTAGNWSTEARQPSTFVERFRGLRGEARHSRLLFETSSVHTFGLARSISVVIIGHDLQVIRAQTLLPNRVIHERRARFILELPDDTDLPAIGAHVEIIDV